MIKEYTTSKLFDLNYTIAQPLLEKHEFPWQVLPHLHHFILQQIEQLDKTQYIQIKKDVWAHHTATISPTAYFTDPCIIQEEAEIRHNAFIRGSVLIGKEAVVGNSTELKNCILFDKAQVPHFNYIGDSILGYSAHMGAGAVTSNLKSDKSLVQILLEKEKIDTHLQKLGAMVGDFSEVGCNSVLCPGSILAKYSQVYPTSCVRGVIPENHIFKAKDNIVLRKE